MQHKNKSNATRILYSRYDNYGMKIIVLTLGDLQDTIPTEGIRISHGSKLCRKVAIDLAAGSSTHSTEEMVNHHHRRKGVDGRELCEVEVEGLCLKTVALRSLNDCE